MTQLEGKVAIVTGGGRGLGHAMVLGMARAGAKVVATAASEKAEIDQIADLANRECGKELVHPLIADVRSPEDCSRVVALADRCGGATILVNNAARGMRFVSDTFLTEPTKFWEVTPETWRLVIDSNVTGPFLMARAVAPGMLARGWGRIVNISMNHDTMRRRGFSPYGPSKAALESETIIWAQDLEGMGVTVNALVPGGVTDTGMIPPGVPDQVRAGFLRPEIVVPPLLWLASEKSDGVTGKRFLATKWRDDLPPGQASIEASDQAGWALHATQPL